MTSLEYLSRRSFLRRATGAAFGISAANVITDLRLIQSAAAQTAGTFPDYKALVCLFLAGGNDASNMLVPNSTAEYTDYAAARGGLALWNDAGQATPEQPYYLLPLNSANTAGREFGVHSVCPEIRDLFNAGRLAFLNNVGTLVEPMTRALYTSGRGRRPPQLFSHNDQVVQWQTSVPDQISTTGWGGRASDLLRASSAWSPGKISLCISMAGSNVFQTGASGTPYQIASAGIGTAGGAQSLSGSASTNRYNRIKDIIALGQAQNVSLFEKDYAGVFQSALDAADQINGALGAIPAGDLATINGTFDPLLNVGTQAAETRSLAGQMKQIARMIAARSSIGVQRQIFFCQLGGFDTHGPQIAPQATLLRSVSRNIKAFHDAMSGLGVSNNVTLFTASDFGRTYPSNGQGSDHGWGTHTMMVGGAVNGGRLYGTFPNLQVNGPDDTSLGRWIPTTSVDTYSATLARWFGVTESNIEIILPNLGRFATRDVGFFV
ncbi:MAG: DUF1501 domain-containing protein [Verrucomicrobiales bacterium]